MLVKACILGMGSFRARVTTPSMLRTGGLLAGDVPWTSPSVCTMGNHGASSAGTSSAGRGSVRSAARRLCSCLACSAACCFRAALIIADTERAPAPESLTVSVRSSSSSISVRSAVTTSWTKVSVGGLLDGLAHSGSVILQVIYGAAVGEAVN